MCVGAISSRFMNLIGSYSIIIRRKAEPDGIMTVLLQPIQFEQLNIKIIFAERGFFDDPSVSSLICQK